MTLVADTNSKTRIYCLEEAMQGAIEVTKDQARQSTLNMIRREAEVIGEAFIRLAKQGCTSFGQPTYAQHVELAAPGLLEMAMELGLEHYQLPDQDWAVHDEAVRFFEVGMSKLLEQIEREGLHGLL